MRVSINNFNSLFKSNYKSTVFTKTYKMRHLIHPFDKNIPVSAVIFPRISTSVRYLAWTCMDSFVFTVENIILRVFIFEQPPSAKISFYWKKKSHAVNRRKNHIPTVKRLGRRIECEFVFLVFRLTPDIPPRVIHRAIIPRITQKARKKVITIFALFISYLLNKNCKKLLAPCRNSRYLEPQFFSLQYNKNR